MCVSSMEILFLFCSTVRSFSLVVVCQQHFFSFNFWVLHSDSREMLFLFRVWLFITVVGVILLNVLCIVIWHATNINHQVLVFVLHFQVKYQESKITRIKTLSRARAHTHTRAQRCTRWEQSINHHVCVLSKLNTKALYIFNTIPTTFGPVFFSLSIVVVLFSFSFLQQLFLSRYSHPICRVL